MTSAASIFKQPFPLAFNNEADCSGCAFYLAGPRCAQQLSGQQHVLWLDGLRKADLLPAAGQLRHRFRTTSSQVGLRRGKLHPVITTQDRGWHEDCRACETFWFSTRQRTQTQNSDLDLDRDIGASFGLRNLFPDSRSVRFAPASLNRHMYKYNNIKSRAAPVAQELGLALSKPAVCLYLCDGDA